jgi:general secretion pathway protein G
MRSSKWRLKPWELLVLGTAIAYVGLTVLAIYSIRVYDGEVARSVILCKHLSDAVEAYVNHPANTDHRLPSRVADLIHPPWGGPSLYRDGAEEPLDPWGNPFRLEHRRTRDGEDVVLVWTAKPDGTKISQFGVGQSAEPRW